MKLLITILCLISSFEISAQKNHQALEIDHLGNIYTIDGNELRKYSPEKELLGNYSDALQGEITSVDVSNPLRLLVFYKEFNQILYLDQTLTPIGDPIDLYNYFDNESQLCCNASSNGFWIYNNEDGQAFKISNQAEILNKSSLLSSYLKMRTPSKMLEYNEQLYFLIPSEGILVLNKFGQFIQQIPLPEIETFCFNEQKLVYLKNGVWFLYNPLATSDSNLFELKDTKHSQSQIHDNKIYILSGDQISIKKLTP